MKPSVSHLSFISLTADDCALFLPGEQGLAAFNPPNIMAREFPAPGYWIKNRTNLPELED